MTCVTDLASGGGELAGRHFLVRAFYLRAIAFIYFMAFLSLANQLPGLFGEHGLLPAREFLAQVRASLGSTQAGFAELPSLFWLHVSDGAMGFLCEVGLALALLGLLGCGHGSLYLALWALYMSFVHIGQLFYQYGWESLLLEAGLLAAFLAPWRGARALSPSSPPSWIVILLLRWLMFRMMLGSGLIKLRGEPCWRDWTCLMFHFETQPQPNPLSWYFHHLPAWVLKGGVLFNHVAELAAPWFIFAPRRLRHGAGAIFAIFQVLLILSGNLSWLNWLTLALCIPCFDDAALRFLAPRALRQRLGELARAATSPSRWRHAVPLVLAALVAWRSVEPVRNLFSQEQVMNGSYDALHFVNTYGAFGSVGRERLEIVLLGSDAPAPDQEDGWREFGFKAKPGDPRRRPPFIAPYQNRLDWQLWIAVQFHGRNPPYPLQAWMVRLIYKLLRGEREVRALLGDSPFGDKPPRFMRADLYQYRFTRPGEDPGSWWKREFVANYLPPLSLESPGLRRFLEPLGWWEGPP